MDNKKPDDIDKLMDTIDENADNLKYPNEEPDDLGELKSIKRLPGMQKFAPSITWGDEYKNWPERQRLQYAERLASSMNHAAAVLQTERDKLLKICVAQEAQIKHIQEQYTKQGDLFHQQLQQQNSEKQQLYQQIVDLTTERNQLKRLTEKLQRIIDTPPEEGETVKA